MMIQKYSPFAILSLIPLFLPWIALRVMGGGDRTGDMAGMGFLLLIYVLGISTFLGLVLAVASFLFREKLRLLSLAGLFPLALVVMQFWRKSIAESTRMQQAQALAVKESAECMEWYERYRTQPERLFAFDLRTADNGQRCALEKALSTQPLKLDREFIGKLFDNKVEVQMLALHHPQVDSDFILQRYPEALRLDILGERSPLEIMVRHPKFPDAQLKEVATSLDVAEPTLVSARDEYRRRAGMIGQEIYTRRNHDYSGDPQPPGDVLPSIPSYQERQNRKKK